MIQRNVAARILTPLLAIAGLALFVQFPLRADDDAKSTKPTETNQKTAEAQIWALEQAYWELNRVANN